MSKTPQLEQFSASYDSMQDRLLLRIRSNNDSEFRFWITRHYLQLLWPMLMKMADAFNRHKVTGNPPTRSTLAEMAHGEAVGRADFASPYQDGSLFPLGEEAVLLARITVKPLRGKAQTLTLLPQSGQGINLELDEKLVHVIARLLQEAANTAEWGLKLDVTADDNATPDVLAAASLRMLH
ncbi:MAG: hypothetical protein K9J80_01070 [Sulfuritalea sp.]|nr:hypothetical protein [Sulfuritalea sp.]MCF8184073.1 hypothetical protein [Polynucleobacter sp.]